MATAQDVFQYMQSLEQRIMTLEQQPAGKRMAAGKGRFQNPPLARIPLAFRPSQVVVLGGEYNPNESPPGAHEIFLAGPEGAEFFWVAIE